MHNIQYCLLFLFLTGITQLGSAQDKNFSQWDVAPLSVNPAFTGTNPQGRGILLHRVQFPQSAGDFVTTYFSYDHNFSASRSNVGIWLMNDIAGAANFRSTNVNVSYAHLVPLSRQWRLRLGLEVGYGTKNLNYVDLLFGDQLTNTGATGGPSQEALANENLNYIDISTGFLIYNEVYWFGFSAVHLNQPNQAFLDQEYRLPIRYGVQGGVRLPLEGIRDNERTIGAAFSYRAQGSLHNLDVGMLGNYKNVSLGLWYRNLPIQESAQGALALQTGLQFNGLRFSYAFEYAFGSLTGLGGAHELGITYLFRYPKRVSRKRPLRYVAFPLFSEYGDERY
ncbi:MAG: PorP/SprF family type IX secretion system membrane protein [Bacteroidota bacterium]